MQIETQAHRTFVKRRRRGRNSLNCCTNLTRPTTYQQARAAAVAVAAAASTIYAILLIATMLPPAHIVGASSIRRAPKILEANAAAETQRVAEGRQVKFECELDEDIGEHKLAWFHKDKRLLLALNNRTIAWKERVRVSSHAQRVFVLQIDNVQQTDKVSMYVHRRAICCSSLA